ncbi:hypothetical protein ACQ4LE_009264 [Meloidogyne hapla]
MNTHRQFLKISKMALHQICNLRTGKKSKKSKKDNVDVTYQLPKVLERMEEASHLRLKAELGEVKGELKGLVYRTNIIGTIVLMIGGLVLKVVADYYKKLNLAPAEKNEIETLKKLLNLLASNEK